MTKKYSIVVIGAGISGLAAAIELAHQGYQVEVFEKNSSFGGRGRAFQKAGFKFDMGPSWYWMPDIFEKFFNEYGKSCSDYFQLTRLDPSYQIIFNDKALEIPADINKTYQLFEDIEKGSSVFLKKFIEDARIKYEIGMNEFVRKPALSIFEFLNWKLLKSVFKMDLFVSLEKVIFKGVKNEKLRQCLSFPVLFLGTRPSQTPALYSLMNYADLVLGTWYPDGGMNKLFEGLYSLALEKGVVFHFDSPIEKIHIEEKKVKGIQVNDEFISCDAVLSSADYHHTEEKLIDKVYRQYSDSYWESRMMAPSAMIFYLGFDLKLKNLRHHNLFFYSRLQQHITDIYDKKVWPVKPCFYVCVSSITDKSIAPEGKENVFILVPVAAGLKESEAEKSRIFDDIMSQLEIHTGQELRTKIVFNQSMSVEKFSYEYNSFKGNAYGLANTLLQTAFFKPKIKHRSVNGLYYAGQCTHPGPGLPPSLISGQISARKLIKDLGV